MGKVLRVVLLAAVLGGCGQEVPRVVVTGYDEAGAFVQRDALQSGLSCPEIATAFTQSCVDAGFESVPVRDCEQLCSGRVQ